MSNRSAAGLRRSAIVERIRLREEWSALKGAENNPKPVTTTKKSRNPPKSALKITFKKPTQRIVPSDVLAGVVVFVDVGSEAKALALRAALSALGANVVPAWGPLVTHVVWAEGGCRAVRARARALACRLVSPLWVEACAAAARRLPERSFPAPARPSDLPDPATLTYMLKRAEMENIDLFNDDKENSSESSELRLRLSTDSEQDTSKGTNLNKSSDTSNDKIDIEYRVNTAPRRGFPTSVTPEKPTKSRRKLFTQKEPDLDEDCNNEEESQQKPEKPAPKLTKQDRKNLKRTVRKLLPMPRTIQKSTQKTQNSASAMSIVLTGMSRAERRLVFEATRKLNVHVQKKVTRLTTHVLLGSCREDALTGVDITGITNITSSAISPVTLTRATHKSARTLSALSGAARGARVLHAQWLLDCVDAGIKSTVGYEVKHLWKIAEKARMERAVLGLTNSEYAYNLFNGMKVRVMDTTDKKDAAIELLTLCGAIVNQDGGDYQDGGQSQNGAEYDMTLGSADGEVNSKWVFDSVAAGRLRTVRRYINKSAVSNDNLTVNSDT